MDVQSPGPDIEELVLFTVGNLLCGLDIRQVQEIGSRLEITAVHHAPPYVRGVINLRGQLLTVIDLRRKLGLPPLDLEDGMRIVVTRGPQGLLGLLADSVADIVDIDSERLESPPGHIEEIPGVFFTAIYKMADRLAAVLDLPQVLAK